MPVGATPYRDATFDLSFAHQFDSAARLVNRVSRDGLPASDPTSAPALLPVGRANEVHTWNTFSAAPILVTSSSAASTGEAQALVLPQNVEFDVIAANGFSGGSAGRLASR